jgi:hypothetical protein
MTTLTDLDRLILQYVARGSLEDTDNRTGGADGANPSTHPGTFRTTSRSSLTGCSNGVRHGRTSCSGSPMPEWRRWPHDPARSP